MNYFELHVTEETAFAHLDYDFAKSLERKPYHDYEKPDPINACRFCRLPRNAELPFKRVHLSSRPPNVAINHIVNPASLPFRFGLMRIDLIPHLPKNLDIEFFDTVVTDICVVNEFKAFRSRSYVYDRGNLYAEHRICKECGAFVYWCLDTDSALASDVEGNSGAFIVDSDKLVLSEALIDSLPPQLLYDVDRHAFDILDAPQDRLPAILPDYPDENWKRRYLEIGGIESLAQTVRSGELSEDF